MVNLMIIVNSKIELPSHNVSVSLIMDIAARCTISDTNIGELVKYTGKNESYVKSAVTAALLLGIIETTSHIEYRTVKSCAQEITSTPSDEIKVIVFRKWLQKWEPFIVFLRYISINDSVETAIRKLGSFYSFNRSNEMLTRLFSSWGKTSGIIDSKGKLIDHDYEIDNKEIYDSYTEDVVSDSKVRLYLIRVLTEEVFRWLTHDEIEELVSSLLRYKEDARSAIECAGRAFEDVLRRISKELGVDAKRQNGISQVANNLYSYRDISGQLSSYIHAKQYNISQAIGDIRNMAGHSKEAKTLERWELSSNGAIGYILMTISAIKSVHNYVKHNKMIF